MARNLKFLNFTNTVPPEIFGPSVGPVSSLAKASDCYYYMALWILAQINAISNIVASSIQKSRNFDHSDDSESSTVFDQIKLLNDGAKRNRLPTKVKFTTHTIRQL